MGLLLDRAYPTPTAWAIDIIDRAGSRGLGSRDEIPRALVALVRAAIDGPTDSHTMQLALEAMAVLDALAAGGSAVGEHLEIALGLEASVESSSSVLRSHLRIAIARGHRFAGNHGAAEEALRSAAQLVRECDDPTLVADTEVVRAQLAFDRGELDITQSLYASASRRYRDEGSAFGLSVAELGIVDTLLERNSVAAARVVLESLLNREQDPGLRVRALLNLAVCRLECDEQAGVHRAVSEALDPGLCASPRARALADYYQGMAFHLEGRESDAAACFERAVEAAVSLGHPRFAAHIRGYAAVAAARDDRCEVLAAELTEVARELVRCGDSRYARLFAAYAARARGAPVSADGSEPGPVHDAIDTLMDLRTDSTHQPLEVRLARRFIEAIGPRPTGHSSTVVPSRPIVRLAADGSYFERQGHAPVGLKRRGALRRIVAALVHHMRCGASEPLSTGAVFEAGWPGDRAQCESAAARVYSAIRALRRMGLDQILTTEGRGYRLTHEWASLVIVDVASRQA